MSGQENGLCLGETVRLLIQTAAVAMGGGGHLIRGIKRVKPTAHVRSIIHIINSLFLKGPLKNQLSKGQIMCVRGQVRHPWSPTLPKAKLGFKPSLLDSKIPHVGLGA